MKSDSTDATDAGAADDGGDIPAHVFGFTSEEAPATGAVQLSATRKVAFVADLDEERYAREFPDYADRTATLIPGLKGYYGNQVLAWICFFVGGWLGNRCAGQCENWPSGF